MEGFDAAAMRENHGKKIDRTPAKRGIRIRREASRGIRREARGWAYQIQKRLDAEKGEPMGRREAPDAGKEEVEQMAPASDDEDLQAIKYRENWINVWGCVGSFEDETTIPPVSFTDEQTSLYSAFPCTSVQVFSAKIAEISGGLRFPLSVYGLIAARDCVDWKRNIIFSRSRDNCQIITKEDPYLELTGPRRAIVLLDPVFIEVMLKIKGAAECDDRTLTFQAIELIETDITQSRMINQSYTGKLSTLELSLGSIVSSVQASLMVRVMNESWPGGFSLFGCTSSCEDTDHVSVLLGTHDSAMPNLGDDSVSLSRSVISVPIRGKLVISLETFEPSKNKSWSESVDFKAMIAGRSSHIFHGSPLTMEINVAWSGIAFV